MAEQRDQTAAPQSSPSTISIELDFSAQHNPIPAIGRLNIFTVVILNQPTNQSTIQPPEIPFALSSSFRASPLTLSIIRSFHTFTFTFPLFYYPSPQCVKLRKNLPTRVTTKPARITTTATTRMAFQLHWGREFNLIRCKPTMYGASCDRCLVQAYLRIKWFIPIYFEPTIAK